MKIELHQISKRFDQNTVVDRVSLTIESGEMFFLLGPSGCGKTTLLRLLAGFLEPDEGELHFGPNRMNTVPPHERRTALVFQNYALWPHLNVFENVAYGLRVRKIAPAELTRRVNEALDQVQMSTWRDRKPGQLSGGQQQRVALARAIVIQPDLLLFDEPLSNLDAQLRLELRAEIKRLHRQTSLTSLYVTHDQEEALSLASRLAVMQAGKIRQIGTPQEIYRQPATRFVAGFIGEMNFFTATAPLARRFATPPDRLLGFRPEHVMVFPHAEKIPARVQLSTYLGSKNELLLLTPEGDEIKAWTPHYFPEGSTVSFEVRPENLHAFPA